MRTFDLATTLETGPPIRPAGELLAWSRDTVTPRLQSAVAQLGDTLRRVVGYHFGWWDEDGAPIAGGGGKAIRPALALASAQAVGGDERAGLPAAVAVELVHNFSLLHDDVMDGDTTRRHRPTAWRVFGIPAALLAGNGLQALAVDVLNRTDHPARPAATKLLTVTLVELLDGQAADLGLAGRTRVGLPECLRIAEQKTGALLGCACALGGLFGGGDQRQVARLRAFGRELGVAFQVVDDVLDIWGDPARTGKPARSDLAERRKTMPVVAALASRTPAAAELATLYRGHSPLSSQDLTRAAGLVATGGGQRWARDQVEHRLARALAHLQAAGPQLPAAAELAALADLVTNRQH